MATTFDAKDPSSPTFYDPSTTALLLLDFHRFLVEKAGGPKAVDALQVAVQMRDWAKTQGITIIHALVDVNGSPFTGCKAAERLKAVVANMGATGADEAPELLQEPTDNEATFKRRPGYVSALKSPGIEDFLQQKGIKSLILTGLSTSGCVLWTTVPATDAEFVVTVISDACADRDEELHEVLLKKVISSGANVSTAKEFQDEYEKARSV